MCSSDLGLRVDRHADGRRPEGLAQVLRVGQGRQGLTEVALSLLLHDDALGVQLQIAEEAAERIVRGLAGSAFEIAFPRRFAWMLKLLGCLPDRLYFPLVAKVTGP